MISYAFKVYKLIVGSTALAMENINQKKIFLYYNYVIY